MQTIDSQRLHRTLLILALGFGLPATALEAQHPADAEQQIAGAVAPAPEEMRDGATVLGFSEAGERVTLRQGDGDLICLADDPKDQRYHAACYFKALEPFMARGRELRASGAARDEVLKTRAAEIASGKLDLVGPSALYSLTGPAGAFDPATGKVTGANRTYVVYIPYATAEPTGLSGKPATGTPWIMSSGKPWAHIMLVQPAAPTEPAAKE